jgi:tripartite ATP-independent transporter DctM subunit
MVIMFGLIALHVPIGIAMGLTGIATYATLVGWGPAMSLAAIEASQTFGSLDFAIIPLFLVMGSFAAAAGLSGDLYRIANALVGHLRGGLSMATIGSCALFGAVCGSSIATVATMTRIALPEMRQRGYRTGLAAGSIAAGGTLGILIPPSIIMVLYAVLAEQFVLTLFFAAVIPGLIAVALQCGAVAVYVRLVPDAAPAAAPLSWSERGRTLASSWGVIALGLVVSVGIYGGIFTVNEAAGVGAAMAGVFFFARRKGTRQALIRVVKETASNTGMIYLVIIGASMLTYFLSASHLPSNIIDWISTLDVPPLVIVLALYVMYIVLGAVFDSFAAMVITLPFVLPVVVGLGYDPVWWGVIMVMVIEIGLITPPIGINVFILHGMAREIPLRTIFKGIAPFLVADVLRLILVTLFPQLALWLPNALGLK